MFGRQQGQDCHWYVREQILHLPALFPQPLAERAGREGKKLLEDPPDLVTAWPSQPDPVPLHLSSLPALLMMTHRKLVSQFLHKGCLSRPVWAWVRRTDQQQREGVKSFMCRL